MSHNQMKKDWVVADNKCKVIEEKEVLNDDDVKAQTYIGDKAFADVSFMQNTKSR